MDNNIYKKLLTYAEEEDQLLLNNVYLKINEKKIFFSHLLFSDKYVYVITPFYASGMIYGNISDNKIFLKQKNGKISNISNPVLENEAKVALLEEYLKIPKNQYMFVSLVVCNNSLIVEKELVKVEQNSCFAKLKDMNYTIKTAEKDNIDPIKHEQTQKMLDVIKKESDRIKAEMKTK